MRTLALIAALTAFCAPQDARARAFWQTYGATAASPAGCGAGCAWNLNSDYFVPRHCDSGQYGLFSPCKTSHYLSPACRNLHPVCAGYCAPFGSFHYKWRDHVYAKRCGCTPLACIYGPWEMDKCGKHCRRTPALDSCSEGCSGCYAASVGAGGERFAVVGELYNVEPMGGEILGVLPAYPSGMGGASRGGMAMPSPMPGSMPGGVPGANPLPVQPASTPAGDALMLPNLFGS